MKAMATWVKLFHLRSVGAGVLRWMVTINILLLRSKGICFGFCGYTKLTGLVLFSGQTARLQSVPTEWDQVNLVLDGRKRNITSKFELFYRTHVLIPKIKI